MISPKTLLLLLTIGFFPKNGYGQEVFTGKVTRTRYVIFEDYEARKSLSRISPTDTITMVNYVCSDTIVAFSSRTDTDKKLKTVDIGEFRYIYDDTKSTYLRIPVPLRPISSIARGKWKKIKKADSDFMLTAPHPRKKDKVVEINYDPTYQYLEQANLGGEFSEFFFHLGVLNKVIVKDDDIATVTINQFKIQDVNCKEQIGNFIVEDVSEDEWVKAYFGDTDTALIASPERQSIEDYHDFVAYDSISSNIENVFKGKVVYLDFWASWCAPCRKEIPYLQEIHRKYSSDQLSIVSVSMDKLEGMDKWKEAINLLGMDWFNYFLREGFENPLIGQLGIQAIPWYILIDKNGKIAAPHAPRPSDPRIEGLLDKLINEN